MESLCDRAPARPLWLRLAELLDECACDHGVNEARRRREFNRLWDYISAQMRTVLPNRRPGCTTEIIHEGHSYIVTFGFDKVGRVREVFLRQNKTGSDIDSMMSDACIAISLLLQHGMDIHGLVAAFGENRDEGANEGPPASPLGAIARAGAEIETKLRPVT